MAKIFISYARQTQTEAQLIAETLRGGGHEVWIDDQLLAHRAFADTIEEQLNAADAVVVLWSAHASTSQWVRAEASRAHKAGKLVQARLDGGPLPMPFDQIHCIDLSSWRGDYDVPQWRSLLASVAAVTGGVRPPAAKPARATGVDRRSERRQVTALYCDLVDAGSLAARLDPEDMMQVLDVYQAACDDAISQYGGVIARYTAHGVLAYFGYPRGDEEEAANAVRASLALRDAVGRLDVASGVVLRTRAGIATGLVVVGELVGGGGVAREPGVVGETPNLATQLETVASANTVVVSTTTRRLTEGLFTYRELGPVILPGYELPVKAFEALDATDVGSRSQARTLTDATPLVGRQGELASMLDCWALAREGEGQVVLLQGEAGIGKSRLVEAFRRKVAETPSVHTVWHCGPQHGANALHPIAQQLAHAAGFERSDDADHRRAKLAAFLEQYGANAAQSHAVLADLLGIPAEVDSPIETLTPEKRKAVTLDTLLAMMDRASSDQPALFVIEDLHWCDPTTLELLDRATRRAADRPWLILATARPEFEAKWSDHADVNHIRLGRLDHGDAQRICDSLGAEALLPEALVSKIIARSDGIPLFVEEITRSVLEAMANAPTADAAAAVTIPNTLQDSLVARLDRLGPAKQVASLGATIGRRFSYELLAAVAPQPPAELRQALRDLTKAGLLERTGAPPNSHYIFRHALIRDAAYESLLKREREALHGRIAEALRDLFPEMARADPALLAGHLTERGAIAEAIPLWAEAGGRAASRGAHVEAVSHLQKALDLLRRQPATKDRAGFELNLLLGLAVSLAGSRGYCVPEVADALAEARAICDGLEGDARLFAVMQNSCSFAIVAGDLPTAGAAAERCAKIAAESGGVEQLIEGDNMLAVVGHLRGELTAARGCAERAIRRYRGHNGPKLVFEHLVDPLLGSLAVLALILDAVGDPVGADKAANELLEHARALGRSFSLVHGLSWNAAHHIIREDYRSALSSALEARELCDANGYESYRGGTNFVCAFAMGRLGKLDSAIETANQATVEFDRLGMGLMLHFHLTELAGLHFAAGDTGKALVTIDLAIAKAIETGERWYLSPAHRRRAEILARIPGADPAAISAALQESIAVAEAQGATAFAARARALLPNALK